MVVALPMTGDTPDGPPPDSKERQLRLPKAVLHRARFLIYRKFVDARASNDANVYHGPSHVAANLAGERPRSLPFVRLVALRHLSGVGSLFGATGVDRSSQASTWTVTSHDGVTPGLIM